MRGFSARATVEQATQWIDDQQPAMTCEKIPVGHAAGRVLSADVASHVEVPSFRRAMMDGFAVQAEDTSGAAAYNRLRLIVIGTSLPGQQSTHEVGRGAAVRIMTGAMVPFGADAVLPAEKVETDGKHVLALDAVPPGKHIGEPGEDIEQGSTVLRQGRVLRPQDLGVLSSIGVAEVNVYRRPKTRIVVTGNELLPPGTVPVDCQITDANSPMLRALIGRDGGDSLHPGIVPDEPASILEALQDDADVIVVSGGSSVGQEDYAPRLLAEHGELAIHGIAMRPSSPAGMGRMQHRLVFLLPGNPVSCLCAYDFFAGRAIRALGGRSRDWPYRSQLLPLKRKLVSVVGRVDYARVRVENNEIEPLAISGASVLSSTTRADGFVILPADSEGYAAGTAVRMFSYDDRDH
jgi:molybdopterin molybdotransferase